MQTGRIVIQMTEAHLLAAVMQCATVLGWWAYHPYLSVKSREGYPDLTLVHPRQRRVVWAELKGPRGVVSADQADWLEAVTVAGFEGYLWTPAEWHAGEIERILKGTST